jgi:hypothetical protein
MMRKILGSLSLAAGVALASTTAAAGEVAWSISMAAPGAAVTIGVPGMAVGPVYYPAPQVVYPAPVHVVPAYPFGYGPRVVYPAPVAAWGVPAYRVVPPARFYHRGWAHAAPVVVAPYGYRQGHRHHHHRHH